MNLLAGRWRAGPSSLASSKTSQQALISVGKVYLTRRSDGASTQMHASPAVGSANSRSADNVTPIHTREVVLEEPVSSCVWLRVTLLTLLREPG